MDKQRRAVLGAGSGAALLVILAAAGIVAPGTARAERNRAAFEAENMADTLQALGASAPTDTQDIRLTVPDVAEDGALVQVGLSSTLPAVSMVAILIEKNPNPLAATFTLPEGTEASVQTRFKMSQTSNVYALVKSEGKFYVASKEIQVTIGGCGD